jgi:hypothetical protein
VVKFKEKSIDDIFYANFYASCITVWPTKEQAERELLQMGREETAIPVRLQRIKEVEDGKEKEASDV